MPYIPFIFIRINEESTINYVAGLAAETQSKHPITHAVANSTLPANLNTGISTRTLVASAKTLSLEKHKMLQDYIT